MKLLKALAIGTNLSSVLIALSTFGILYLLELDNWFWISCSVIIGLLVGIADRPIDGILYFPVL